MKNDLYLEIIKKQQELINLMLQAGIGSVPQSMAIVEVGNNEKECKELKCDLEGFSLWLKRKGMSENCIDSYIQTVDLFFREYGVMNEETLARYEVDLKEKWKPKTVNLRIAGMTKYFKYLDYNGFEFVRVKEQKKTFCDDAINEEQYETLMNWAKLNNKKVWLICKVIANTGVRASELINLKTEEIGKGFADIVGKGNKTRRIYFTNTLLDEIKGLCGSVYVIENRYGQQMSTRGVAQLLITAGEKSGVPKEVMHPHSFRHFFAKQFLKNKQDVTLLGDLLGHSNISTTAIYTRMTSQEQQDEIEKIVGW